MPIVCQCSTVGERSGQSGYIMLIALVITALGLAAVLSAVALAAAGERVAAADVAAERAVAAAQAGLADAADRLVWGGLPALWQGTAETTLAVRPDAGRSATVSVRRLTGGAEPDTFAIDSRGSCGTGAATMVATVVLETIGLPRGVTVAGDLRVAQPFSVDGCGVYVDGDVDGRHHMGFAAGEGGATGPDLALPAAWPTAAVHAGGHIYDAAGEVHAIGTASGDDTDACSGAPNARDDWPPDPDVVTALVAHHWVGVSAAADTLDLAGLADRLTSPAPPPQSGIVVTLRPPSGRLTVSGWWPQTPETPQITLLVLGDADLVAAGSATGVSVHGALLVSGRLRVATPSLVVGFLAASGLDVAAPLNVVLPAAWRQQPPPGSVVAIRAEMTGRSSREDRSLSFRAEGLRRTISGRGEGCRCPCRGPEKLLSGSRHASAASAGDRCRPRLPVEALPELTTMPTDIVGEWLRRPLPTQARGCTLKQSSRVAEVGAGMAKGWRTRVV